MRDVVNESIECRTPYVDAGGLVRVYPGARGALSGTGIVWAHGGGFVAGDLDTPEADGVARTLAARGATVISVDYRLVGVDGSNAFPAASDDMLAAWRWATLNATQLGVHRTRLLIGGASAGGNLAAGVVLRLLDDPSDTPRPTGLVLAYPTLHLQQSAPAGELREALMANPAADRFGADERRTMYERYLGGDPSHAPAAAIPGTAGADLLRSFPPTIIVNSDIDELRVSGEAFGAALDGVGVPVAVHREPGTVHGHLNGPDSAIAARTVARLADWIAASGQ